MIRQKAGVGTQEGSDGVHRNAGKMGSALKKSITCPVETKDTRDLDQREEGQLQPGAEK